MSPQDLYRSRIRLCIALILKLEPESRCHAVLQPNANAVLHHRRAHLYITAFRCLVTTANTSWRTIPKHLPCGGDWSMAWHPTREWSWWDLAAWQPALWSETCEQPVGSGIGASTFDLPTSLVKKSRTTTITTSLSSTSCERVDPT